MRQKLTKNVGTKYMIAPLGVPAAAFFNPSSRRRPPRSGILVPRQGQAAAAARSVCRK